MGKKKGQQQKPPDKVSLNHVGGVANDAGGVDPSADENLIRLSGGP
ncbi:hypothetical protein SDC9_08999 [bioreactor metagenome]|uniref:Uncharacterized protein n=1 Tax=bioreactor metagenome TaxID=1076179 RepID=A0A644T8V9_9ZZZZ|nr:hypothetical protein [Negativicutes bacterium]